MTEEVRNVPVEEVDPSPYQPRRRFDAAGLEELAASISQQGVIQPIIVRAVEGRFQLIAGERRLRAVRGLGLPRIPAIVRGYSDEEALEAALVENLQREDISVVETARAYHRLAADFGYTQGAIAQRTGKSRAAVANTLRLLQLPDAMLEALDGGDLTEGHARALLPLPYPSLQIEVGEWAIRNGVSVRELERKVRSLGSRQASPPDAPVGRPDSVVAALEDELRGRFGTKVELIYRAGSGSISIEFYGDEDLQRILEICGLR